MSTQATQPDNTSHPTDWPQPRGEGESVRITAEIRRQVVTEFLLRELTHQQAVVAGECNDLKVRRANGLPCAAAENRASNATAVLQYIGATLAGYSDNRDFAGVTK